MFITHIDIFRCYDSDIGMYVLPKLTDYHIKSKPNQLEEAFSNILDNIFEKPPKNSNEILLRYDAYGEIDTYSENTDITVNHYQTTTSTDLGNIANTKFIWEITPLPSPKRMLDACMRLFLYTYKKKSK